MQQQHLDTLQALGAEVSHLDQNRLKVQWAHGEETLLQCGSSPGKNEPHPDVLLRLRQILVQQGISHEHPESFSDPRGPSPLRHLSPGGHRCGTCRDACNLRIPG